MSPVRARTPAAVGLLSLVGVHLPLDTLHLEAGGLLAGVDATALPGVAARPGIAARPSVAARPGAAARSSISAVGAVLWLASSSGLDQKRRHGVLVDGGAHLAEGDLGAADRQRRERWRMWELADVACDSVSWCGLRSSVVSWHWCTAAAVSPA